MFGEAPTFLYFSVVEDDPFDAILGDPSMKNKNGVMFGMLSETFHHRQEYGYRAYHPHYSSAVDVRNDTETEYFTSATSVDIYWDRPLRITSL